MHFIEQSSRGIPTIIKNGNGVFIFGTSFIKCVIPYNIVDKNKMEKMNGVLPRSGSDKIECVLYTLNIRKIKGFSDTRKYLLSFDKKK